MSNMERKLKGIDEMRQDALARIPFIIDGKEPIELKAFDSKGKLEIALKNDMKEKYTIKLKRLIGDILEKFNIYRWDNDELIRVIGYMILDVYDLFGIFSKYRDEFFDCDKFYNWQFLYLTFDELNIEQPYDVFIDSIVFDVQEEIEEELDLSKMIREVLNERKKNFF